MPASESSGARASRSPGSAPSFTSACRPRRTDTSRGRPSVHCNRRRPSGAAAASVESARRKLHRGFHGRAATENSLYCREVRTARSDGRPSLQAVSISPGKHSATSRINSITSACEADHILDPDRRFSNAAERLSHLIKEGGIGVHRRDHFNQPHSGDRREEMHSKKTSTALLSERCAGFGDRQGDARRHRGPHRRHDDRRGPWHKARERDAADARQSPARAAATRSNGRMCWTPILRSAGGSNSRRANIVCRDRDQHSPRVR